MFVKLIFRCVVNSRAVLRGCQITAVERGSRDGLGIHKRYGSDLAVCRVGAFTVREVSRAVTDTEIIVARCVGSSEARSAERCLHTDTVIHQII